MEEGLRLLSDDLAYAKAVVEMATERAKRGEGHVRNLVLHQARETLVARLAREIDELMDMERRCAMDRGVGLAARRAHVLELQRRGGIPDR